MHTYTGSTVCASGMPKWRGTLLDITYCVIRGKYCFAPGGINRKAIIASIAGRLYVLHYLSASRPRPSGLIDGMFLRFCYPSLLYIFITQDVTAIWCCIHVPQHCTIVASARICQDCTNSFEHLPSRTDECAEC